MTIALIVAAGSGERLGAGRPKAFVELAGRSLLQWSIDALSALEEIDQIVVALPAGTFAPAGTIGVQGGKVRSESVRRALTAAGEGDPVLVHDAARPLLSLELVQAVIAGLECDPAADAAIAAAPTTDTVKRVDSTGVVSETLDRSELWAVQTPQAFRRAALERALDVSDEVLAEATDDAWLIERSKGKVIVVKGSEENMKITTPLDLQVAEMLLTRRTRSS
jgi:2-C-methyl-D-erythritol 4-phosphate cytidylyltransferase